MGLGSWSQKIIQGTGYNIKCKSKSLSVIDLKGKNSELIFIIHYMCIEFSGMYGPVSDASKQSWQGANEWEIYP